MSIHDKVLKAKADSTLIGCTRRIVNTYRLATPEQIEAGSRWYAEAGRTVTRVARAGGMSKERAAVVVAHLSSRTQWQRNVAGALQLVREGRADAIMGRNIDKALMAIEAKDPWTTFTRTTPKTRRFALNLLGHTDVVTVDVWALRVALGQGWGADWRTGSDKDFDKLMKRARVYDAFEDAYIRAARSLNLLPTTVQAVTWIVARNGRVE